MHVILVITVEMHGFFLCLCAFAELARRFKLPFADAKEMVKATVSLPENLQHTFVIRLSMHSEWRLRPMRLVLPQSLAHALHR